MERVTKRAVLAFLKQEIKEHSLNLKVVKKVIAEDSRVNNFIGIYKVHDYKRRSKNTINGYLTAHNIITGKRGRHHSTYIIEVLEGVTGLEAKVKRLLGLGYIPKTRLNDFLIEYNKNNGM